MKTIYMIYEESFGHIGVTFTDEKDAQEYINIANMTSYRAPYFIRKKELYNDMDEYVEHNKDKMINMLERSLIMITSLGYNHTLKFKNGNCSMNYYDIKEIAVNNSLDIISFYDEGYYLDTVESDLEVVKAKYIEINEEINKYKQMIEKLKSENNKKNTRR